MGNNDKIKADNQIADEILMNVNGGTNAKTETDIIDSLSGAAANQKTGVFSAKGKPKRKIDQ